MKRAKSALIFILVSCFFISCAYAFAVSSDNQKHNFNYVPLQVDVSLNYDGLYKESEFCPVTYTGFNRSNSDQITQYTSMITPGDYYMDNFANCKCSIKGDNNDKGYNYIIIKVPTVSQEEMNNKTFCKQIEVEAFAIQNYYRDYSTAKEIWKAYALDNNIGQESTDFSEPAMPLFVVDNINYNRFDIIDNYFSNDSGFLCMVLSQKSNTVDFETVFQGISITSIIRNNSNKKLCLFEATGFKTVVNVDDICNVPICKGCNLVDCIPLDDYISNGTYEQLLADYDLLNSNKYNKAWYEVDGTTLVDNSNIIMDNNVFFGNPKESTVSHSKSTLLQISDFNVISASVNDNTVVSFTTDKNITDVKMTFPKSSNYSVLTISNSNDDFVYSIDGNKNVISCLTTVSEREDKKIWTVSFNPYYSIILGSRVRNFPLADNSMYDIMLEVKTSELPWTTEANSMEYYTSPYYATIDTV